MLSLSLKKITKSSKRMISLFLAVVLLVQFAPISQLSELFGIKEVNAATHSGFSASTAGKMLAQASNNDIPIRDDKSIGANDAAFEWRIAAASSNERYLFNVVLANDLELNVYVSMYGVNKIKVYTAFNDNPTTPLGISGNQGINPALPTIYGYVLATDEYNFRNYDDYRASQESSITGADVQLPIDVNSSIVPPIHPGTLYNKPEYIIPYNSGLSTIYNGMKINFLYSDGKFYLTIDGIKKDIIYDCNLTTSDTNNVNNLEDFANLTAANKEKSTINLYRGLDIKCKPYAKQDGSNPLGLEEDVLNHVDTVPPSSPTIIDEWPATDKNGIRLEFKLPKKWNGTTFNIPAAPDAFPLSTNFQLVEKHDSGKAITVKVDDIFTAGGTTIQTSNSTVTAVYSIVGTDVGQLQIDGLNGGTFFNTRITTWSSGTGHNFESKTVALEGYQIYTFLPYTVQYKSGKYYAVIKPYRHAGFYLIKSSPADTAGFEPISQGESKGAEEPLYLPLNISRTTGPLHYQIYFSPEKSFDEDDVHQGSTPASMSKYVCSQKVLFKSDPNAPLLSPPDVLELKYKLTELEKSDPDFERQGDLVITMHWDIGELDDIKTWLENSTGKTQTLHYNLFEILSPAEDLSKEAQFDSLTATLTLQADGTIDVEYKGTGVAPLSTFVVHETVYDTAMNGEWADRGLKSKMLRTTVNLRMRAGDVSVYGDYAPTENLFFFYPGMYFLHVKQFDPSMPGAILGSSNYAPMTLNSPSPLDYPTAQNLIAFNPVTTTNGVSGATSDRTSFDVRWNIPAKAIKTFLDNNYKYKNPKLYYNLYISQDEKAMKALADKDDATKPNKEDVTAKQSFLTAIVNNKPDEDGNPVENVLYFSDINDNKGFAVTGYTDAREALRNGEIVCIERIEVKDLELLLTQLSEDVLTKTLDGMDKNQKYYVSVDSDLEFTAIFADENGDLSEKPVTKASGFSNIASITTIDDLNIPGPEETTPKAPILEWIKDRTLSTSATIRWDKIFNLDAEGNDISVNEYELIRLKEKPMDPKLMDVKSPFGIFFGGNFKDQEKIGLMTDIAKGNASMLVFNGTSFVAAANPKSYVCTSTPKEVYMQDNTLTPNTLYFYYARTVQIVDGQKSYSSWSGVSVTSAVVDGPENLKILRDGVKYDPMSEFWIEFDVLLHSLDKLGVEYDLQYSLRENEKDWGAPVTMNASTLKASAKALIGDKEGYFHFVYKLTGLKASTLYSIRVRMIDKKGDASMWSNTAQTRTDTDPDEYLEKKEAEDWIKYLKDEMLKLIKDVVWYMQDTAVTTSVMYRPTMFSSVLSGSTDGTIALNHSDAAQAVYFFPGTVVSAANDAGKAFTLNHDNMKIIFSSGSIDVEYSDASAAVLKSIKAKEIADYFVRVTITYSNSTATIDANAPISDQVDISVEFIGSKTNTTTFDNQILSLYMSKIADDTFTSDAQKELVNMVENNTDKESMVVYVSNYIVKARRTLMDETNTQLTKILNKSYSITSFPKPVIIQVAKPEEDAIVKGHQKISNVWQAIDVKDYGDGKAIFANAPGTFIFTGYIFNLPGLDKVSGGDSMKALIAKYGLDDYFGKGATFDLDNKTTVYMIVGVISRIAGNDKVGDPVQFLKTKGYTVSTRNKQNAQTQEAIYYVMALYEMKTNTKISTIKIKDYTKISDIQGIDSKYAKSIQVAFELGLYSDKSKLPKGNITVNEFLDCLVALGKKVKL